MDSQAKCFPKHNQVFLLSKPNGVFVVPNPNHVFVKAPWAFCQKVALKLPDRQPSRQTSPISPNHSPFVTPLHSLLYVATLSLSNNLLLKK